MGILGLTPFLQKSFPGVIKTVATRLQGFSGKTIVLDGTLITQRLHFTNDPHPYRHVLGWYRIIQEFKQYNVNGICVFDGRERTIAKLHESQRRKTVRKIASLRESLERRRLSRLQHLNYRIKQLKAVDVDTKRHVLRALQEAQTTFGPIHSHKPLDVDHISQDWLESFYNQKENDDVDLRLDSTDLLPYHQPFEELPEDIFVRHSPFDVDALTEVKDGYREQDLEEFHPPSSTTPQSHEGEEEDSTDLVQAIVSLYNGYASSLAASTPISPHIPLVEGDMPEPDVGTSKTQQILTREEDIIWGIIHKILLQSTTTDLRETASAENTSTLEHSLSTLVDKSHDLVDSYRKRANPPKQATYEESKAILKAMGIPVIETVGPFEAEALASALVSKGLADYVASEDTDVLVYEVPLLRNITNHQAPLVYMSGAQVRTELGLSRSSYVDFAVLLGTDFTQRIKNLGPSRALRFIKTYGTIEEVVKSEPKYIPQPSTDSYLEQVQQARAIFNTFPPLPPADLLRPGQTNDAELNSLLGQFRLKRRLESDARLSPVYNLEGNYFDDNPRMED